MSWNNRPIGYVGISKLTGYDDPDMVFGAIRDAVRHVGPLASLIPPNADIIVKPNFVAAAPAAAAATTHPAVIAAAVRLAVEAGARRVRIADTPAFGSAKRAARVLNLAAYLGDLDVEVCDMTTPRVVRGGLNNGCFTKLHMAQDVLDCDFVLNLPKIKAHGQMVFTGAVKNLFGCVPGRRKALMHCQVGNSRAVFGRMLVDVARVVQPALHIADGVIAMEGQGPRKGDPRPWGWILASNNPFALDHIAASALGYELDEVPTLTAAKELGVFDSELDEVRVLGATPAELQLDGWRKAQPIPVTFNPFRLARGYLRHQWLMRRERS
ncbi:MAG: DUF362 domain-containing protein [Verrucomicrobiota bacterium]|nr:DUF362 domain-containing protein [Verrucomicrobiota bacterium]